MFQQLGAHNVVEALQDHPMAQVLLTPGAARDDAVTTLAILSLDVPDAAKVVGLQAAVARFLGIGWLDEVFDQAFGRACQSPMANEGLDIARRVLNLRLDYLAEDDRIAQVQPWLAQAAAFPLDAADSDARAQMKPFWRELARHPDRMQGPTKFLARLADSDFLKCTLETMGESAWALIFSAAWAEPGAKSSRLEVLASLDVRQLTPYPELRQVMLDIIEEEIRQPEGVLAFLQRDNLDKIWDGYRNAAVKLCGMVGMYLTPSYCTDTAAAWFDLIKHDICQQALIAQLPRDPVLLAKLDDAGLESALSGDLGL
jgi:hypothetical protein